MTTATAPADPAEPEPEPEPEPERIRVMATINLPGLARGHVALADPRVPYIAGALAGGHLVPAPLLLGVGEVG